MKQLVSGLALAALVAAGAAVAGPAVNREPRRYDPPAVSIYFPQGKSSLTDAAADVLDETAANVNERKARRLIIVGYSDHSASERRNLRIASARAVTVKNALIDRGIDPALILIVADNSPPAPQADKNFIRDRRAEITIEPNKSRNF